MKSPIAASKLMRSAALPAATHLLPSVLVLGQWWPGRLPPPRALPGGLCRWRGPATGRDEVALTFDDGPDPEATEKVLNLLDEREARATFFCLGERAERYSELVREIVSRGHDVGVHGYRHQHHLLATARAVRRDVDAAVASLGKILSSKPRFFRPPYGQVSGGSLAAAHQAGLETVLWSSWGREWVDRDPHSVAARVTRSLEPGAIVLLHDSDATAPRGTAAIGFEALHLVLDRIEDQGLKSVSLSQLTSR